MNVSAVLGISLPEIILLSAVSILLITALTMLFKRKPFQTAWLIAIVIVPVLGAFVYIAYRIWEDYKLSTRA